MENDVIRVIQAVLDMPARTAGAIVEAGCYVGGSAAKISLAARLAGRKLYLFDSFEGLPANEEHAGGAVRFPQGSYRGSVEQVKRAISSYGAIESCHFVKGWFEETMPAFREPVTVAFIDVNLRSSTATCLKYLYPLLTPGGTVFCHDGHLPLVIGLLDDDAFWNQEVGVSRPEIKGLKTVKVVEMRKSA
jgi:O-methyltransferase